MTSLYCLLARDAEVGVIFRRGPSAQTLLIHWDLRTHTFTPGQWFKGRIYERKSDLSPDGTKLVCFAAKHRGAGQSWIAVSSPPYFTAHVLWPGSGTWNGISLFESNERLVIDAPTQPADGFSIPRALHVTERKSPGHFFKFQDHERLIRDGWIVSSGDPVYHPRKASKGELEYRKTSPDGSFALIMSEQSSGEISYIVRDDADILLDVTADWADVRGMDVFTAQGGKLFRQMFARQGKRLDAGQITELADFSDLTFSAVLAPDWAKQW